MNSLCNEHKIITIRDSLEDLSETTTSRVLFPKLKDCAHFHYCHVNFDVLRITLHDITLQPSAEVLVKLDVHSQYSKTINEWTIRRQWNQLVQQVDRRLHRCVQDRTISGIPDLSKVDLTDELAVRTAVTKLCSVLNALPSDSMRCGPLLCFFELDSHGRRLVLADETRFNYPAVASARVVRRFEAHEPAELNLQVGDLVNLLDMSSARSNDPSKITWWRGKSADFQVGFFPSDCVRVLSKEELMIDGDDGINNASSMSCSSIADQTGSVDGSRRVAGFLNRFFARRPSLALMKQSGIVRERVFGCDLGEYLHNHEQEVPEVVRLCCEVIEKHGIVQGIYRLSGKSSNVDRLRVIFDEGNVPDFDNKDMTLRDVHCLCSLLKSYFRDLPNPLFTFALYSTFKDVYSKARSTWLSELYDVLRQLPPPHYRTSKALFAHLEKMASQHAVTSMDAKNLAIVWAPNLLHNVKSRVRLQTQTMQPTYDTDSMFEVMRLAELCEFMIINFEQLWGDDARLKKSVRPATLPTEENVSSHDTHRSSSPRLISLTDATRKFGSSTAQARLLTQVDGALVPAASASVVRRVKSQRAEPAESTFISAPLHLFLPSSDSEVPRRMSQLAFEQVHSTASHVIPSPHEATRRRSRSEESLVSYSNELTPLLEQSGHTTTQMLKKQPITTAAASTKSTDGATAPILKRSTSSSSQRPFSAVVSNAAPVSDHLPSNVEIRTKHRLGDLNLVNTRQDSFQSYDKDTMRSLWKRMNEDRTSHRKSGQSINSVSTTNFTHFNRGVPSVLERIDFFEKRKTLVDSTVVPPSSAMSSSAHLKLISDNQPLRSSIAHETQL